MFLSLLLLLLLHLTVPGSLAGESVCKAATEAVSAVEHTYAVDRLEVGAVSFSSCHLPDDMGSVPTFWSDVRFVAQPDLWLWLGDNIYQDGQDMNAKRREYNRVRENSLYRRDGPVSVSKGRDIYRLCSHWLDLSRHPNISCLSLCLYGIRDITS